MDIQSYWNPVWISDSTHSAIFDWVTKVNATAPVTPLFLGGSSRRLATPENLC